jgi:hypothetical protein
MVEDTRLVSNFMSVPISISTFMPISTSFQYAIRIAVAASAGVPSRARTQFNTLVETLRAARIRLAYLHEQLPKIRALADSEYRPLKKIFDGHQKRMLLALDQAYCDKALSNRDKKKLVKLICSTAVELMQFDEGDAHDAHDAHDAQVEAIYHKHRGRHFDLDIGEEKVVARKTVCNLSGVELDADADVDVNSPAAFLTSIQEKMAGHAPDEDPAAQARVARHQAHEAKLKQSIRDIFRKLASALHPDREIDPAEHERKTALMKRVNVAYAANDLLSLLELQLEIDQIDQIDQTGLDNLGDDRIKQYNRILEGQINEIGSEMRTLESAFAFDMGWQFGRRRTPKVMMKGLRADIAEMRANIESIETDLDAFADIKRLKVWLKGWAQRLPHSQ